MDYQDREIILEGHLQFTNSFKKREKKMQEILKNRNDFYDPTYEFDYPSHVPSERAANSKGVRYYLFLFWSTPLVIQMANYFSVTYHTGKRLDIWSAASFGLWGRKVYFEVLWTIWSKDRVISGLKTAQNLNFKVRNPLKMINFMSK